MRGNNELGEQIQEGQGSKFLNLRKATKQASECTTVPI